MNIITLDPTAAGRYLTDDEIDALADGRAKLRVLYVKNGMTPRSMRLNDLERARFDLAKARGFYDESDKGKVGLLAYRWLETHRLPIVSIKRTRKYCRVQMDLLPVERTRRDWWSAVQPKDPPPSIGGSVRHWGCYTLIERVPVANGEACAEGLLALFDQACAAGARATEAP